MERDVQMIERLERLYPAVVADCLDRVGLRTQVLDARIRPLDPASRLAGYAATVHFVEVDRIPESSDDWSRTLLAAIDALRPGDVVVASTSRRPSESAQWIPAAKVGNSIARSASVSRT
jgi:regulator of RNase E activity RraA